MRKIIISLSGVLVLAIGFFASGALAKSKEDPEKKTEKTVKLVYVEEVQNSSIPISITTSGSLLARDRMTLFSEVQGVFIPSSKRFKAGERYRKGETLIRINSEEFTANVIAQRSAFRSLITSILPDLRFDYPASFEAWNNYLKSIDIEKRLPELPKPQSEKEESYLTGKSINVTYYNIKNLEARLRKYTISAPYSGVLVDVSINAGALVSPGQKLGEFISPSVFELELNVNANLQ
ncbi:MAG: efflux RND transporter periplasmic adaptor subunit, partial [Crocinitomicaceae bacterium]